MMTAALAAMAVICAFHDMLTVDVVLWWWALTIGLMEADAAPPLPTNEQSKSVDERPNRRRSGICASSYSGESCSQPGRDGSGVPKGRTRTWRHGH